MHMVHHSDMQIFWQRTCKVLLSLCWILGLMIGMLGAALAGNSFFLTMRGAFEFSVSIPGLLLVTSLPFLFTAFAVYFNQPAVLLIVIIFKAIAFGFSLFGITIVYGSGSWLLHLLLMFSDIGSLPCLMWLWFRYATLTDKDPTADLLLCLAVSLVFGIVDICVVSPFVAMLI